MSVTRIYAVADVDAVPGIKPRLIRASSQAQALRYVAKDTFAVSVATQEELVADDRRPIETVGNEEIE